MDQYVDLSMNILFLILVLIIQYHCQKRLYDNQKVYIKAKPLYDVFHTFLGTVKNKKMKKLLCSSKYGLADLFPGIFPIFIIIYLMYHKNINLLSKFFYTAAILFLLRSITFSLTTLPTPKHCNSPPFLGGGCGDLLYSGHYIWFTITMYIILQKTNIPYKIIPIMAYIVSIISTLMCRNHYSVDILISIVLSYLFSSVIIK